MTPENSISRCALLGKYESLIKVLDQIRNESPLISRRYRPAESNPQLIDSAHCYAYIHLYLKVSFGILDFDTRERLITDGSEDGGIDAYYIDTENFKIYFIQAKFRTTSANYGSKHITLDELAKMDIDRITKGENSSERGVKYNDKILNFQKELSRIDDIAKYEYIAVILANVKDNQESQIKKLTGTLVKIINHGKAYRDLLFPVVSGTHYNASDLKINITLPSGISQPRIRYQVEANDIECEISVLFVPTLEIAKNLLKYKNSILKYNPRSFLSLKDNIVNEDMGKTIKEKKKNEFALYNNGITMLSDQLFFEERTGKKNTGQLIVTNPQILNGGQTAFTLAQIYEEEIARNQKENLFAESPELLFENKEVMLKVITITDTDIDHKKRLQLIEAISKATNQQSEIFEADRRSNDEVQVSLQTRFFEDFGYFYERKRGEFYDGIQRGYISRDVIIRRDLLARLAYALRGDPLSARRYSDKQLFSKSSFDSIYKTSDNYKDLFYAYLCHVYLDELRAVERVDPSDTHGFIKYGYALLYGKFAVIYVGSKSVHEEITSASVERLVKESMDNALKDWVDFETFAKEKKGNSRYFFTMPNPKNGLTDTVLDFANYYKGATLNHDIQEFFKLDKLA